MKRSEVTLQALKDMGWERHYNPGDDGEPTIKDIAEYLHDGFYDCKVEEEKGFVYETEAYEGICYYQHKVTRRYKKELMYCRAHDPKLQAYSGGKWFLMLERYVKIGEYVSNYMGD